MVERFHLAADTETARLAAEALFARVREELRLEIPESADIWHIGATAIPGCATKGDLDLVVRVGPQEFDVVEAKLAALLPRNDGSIRTREFAAFADDARTPPLGLQLTVRGGRFDVFHLFVEALRANPMLVTRYNALKTRFDGRSMKAYRAAKAHFIDGVLTGTEITEA